MTTTHPRNRRIAHVTGHDRRFVLERLEAAIRHHGSASAFARAKRISPQHVSDVRRGRRDVTPKLLGRLGMCRVECYQMAAPAVGGADK